MRTLVYADTKFTFQDIITKFDSTCIHTQKCLWGQEGKASRNYRCNWTKNL